MTLTPFFTTLAIVLSTRAILRPFDAHHRPWLRIATVVLLQSVYALLSIINSANWWIIVIIIAVIDITHIILINIMKDRNAFGNGPASAQSLTFGLTTILLAAFIASPAIVPGFNSMVRLLVARFPGHGVIALLTPEAFRWLVVYVCGLWVVGVEVNNPIALIIKRAGLTPVSPQGVSDGSAGQSPEPARGRMIGILERMIVFVFAMTGNLSALGLVLAAKALARFKDLDDRDFAEYVLIGTLVSITAAVLVGLLFRTAVS